MAGKLNGKGANFFKRQTLKLIETAPAKSNNDREKQGVISASYIPSDNPNFAPVVIHGEEEAYNYPIALPVFANDTVLLNKRNNVWTVTGNLTTPRNIFNKVKSVSTTKNDTVLTLDPGLSINIPTPGTWLVEIETGYLSDATGKLNVAWQVPADVAGNRNIIGPGTGSTSAVRSTGDITRISTSSYTTAIVYPSVGGPGVLREWAIFTTIVGGTVGLVWAKQLATGAGSTIYDNSYIRLTRLK